MIWLLLIIPASAVIAIAVAVVRNYVGRGIK